MKWQQVALLLIGILSAGGVLTYVDLFSGLFQLIGVNVVYSGDIVCGETCESYINITTSYWRICFAGYEGTKYEDEILFKKRSRSRTLHVNLDKVDNIISTNPEVEVDWLVPTYGKKWRPLRDGDCWGRLRNNKIKLVGYKEKEQTIKWGFDIKDDTINYVSIDPIWEGIKEKKTIKTEYTYNTKLEEYDDGSGNAIIYSGMRYADSSGVKIEDAPSLKTCEFCDNININVQHIELIEKCIEIEELPNGTKAEKKCWNETMLVSGQDGTYPLNIINYNNTAITLDILVNSTKLNKNSPLKVYSKGSEEDNLFLSTVNLKTIGDKQTVTLPFGFDKVLKYGHSTIVTYNTTAGDGEVIEDSSTGWDPAHDSTNGIAVSYTSGKTEVVTYKSGSSYYQINRVFMPINTTLLPDDIQILTATFHIYVNSLTNQDNDGNDFIVIVGNTTQASVDSLVTADIDNAGAVNNPIEMSDRLDLTDMVANAWNKFILNTTGINSINKSGMTKFGIREGHDVLDDPVDTGSNQVFINTSKSTAYPYLNITYTPIIDTTPPTYSNRKQNITTFFFLVDSAIQFNITITDASKVLYWNFSTNLTTGNTWNNITNSTDLTDPSQVNVSIISKNVGDVFGYMFCSSDNESNVGCDTLRTFVINNYTLIITDPTTSSPKSVSENDDIIITFNLTINDVEQTSGVTVDNATIGGNVCGFNDYCTGTPNTCGSYSTEDSCNINASCSWTVGSGLTELYSDNFEDSVDWIESGACSSYWTYGTSTPSGGTGPQSGDSDDTGTNFVYMETSSGSCDGSPNSGYLEFNQIIDWDAQDGENITFYTNFYGVDGDLCDVIVEEDSSGSWVQLGTWNQGTDDGNSGTAWTLQYIDASSLTGTGSVRFFANNCVIYQGDIAIDNWNITSLNPSSCSGTANSCNFANYKNNSACIAGGCDLSKQNYTGGVGWQSNISISGDCFTGLTGLKDLFLNVTYKGNTVNDTEINAISYAVTDTCSCPASGDWNIDCSDNCVTSSDCIMDGSDIHTSGSGTWTIKALISNFGNLFNRCELNCRNTPTCFG